MAYEYGFMVHTVTLQPGMADLTSDEVARGLAQGLGQMAQRITKAVQAMPEGPWEIVSHDMTRIDRHLILSFLLQKEVPPISPTRTR